MRKERIKEIIQEINNIRLAKIGLIANGKHVTDEIITDETLNNEEFLRVSVAVAVSRKFDMAKMMYDLDKEETELYDELIALTKWEKAQ